jgi:hypothetical protein
VGADQIDCLTNGGLLVNGLRHLPDFVGSRVFTWNMVASDRSIRALYSAIGEALDF